MGIRDDWPLFAGIIEKTLAGITEAEHQAIYSKWIRLETDPFYKTRAFWYWAGGIFACVLVLVGTVVVWNRTLQRQVNQRTEAVRFNEMRLDALLQLNERADDSIQEIIEFAFRQMVRLTRSRFGYLAFDDQEGMIYSVRSSGSPSPEQPATNVTSGFTIETRGLWGEAVRRRTAVISNSYPDSNPMKKGLPQEYSTLARYMNVPIFKGDKVVVVAGVGNKDTDYDDSDLRQLTLLAQGLWRRLQRKQGEQALAREEKNLRDIVENSPNGITIIQNGKVVYRNSKQLRLVGDINLGENIEYDHIHSEDRAVVEDFYRSILKGAPKRTELNFKFYTTLANRSKENLRWVTCLVTPITYRDDRAFLLTTIDRTRARELEHLLTVQDKMASLGRVAAGIGHEVRNPLSGINIYLRSIEKGVADPAKSHKIGPAIDAIRTASGKMEAVVKRVIDFSKPCEPKVVALDINAPVADAVNLAAMGMGKKGVTLTTDLGDNLPFCKAEPNLIEEVVLNLINNAVDAMNGQDDDRQIRVTTDADGDLVRLAVDDTGPGVPADLTEKVFEPFYTTKAYSTGIGLSLCHRIITDHKGSIRVEPARKDRTGGTGGARFVVELPAVPNDEKHPQPRKLS
ncbi:MAG TPA: signal transduction histidine-protein kinase AtoS [Desulfobacteraceae bacterium]|nr:signal transduction histidine-protein kinase AtoS [Desulfobacteraceae bacterium]